jgi:segregation and condensation protein A
VIAVTDPAEQTSSVEQTSSAELTTQPETEDRADKGFSVRLTNFEGPFDLLLQLISKHKLDITEVALSQVTDEFIAHIKAAGDQWDLEQTSQFIVVAATLLDLKAARLLPSGEIDDPEDLALLEARDLLFARLLQYRAFKQLAAAFAERLQAQSRRVGRTAGLDPEFTRLLPEITIAVTPERFARIAARAMTPKEADVLSLAHLHAPEVSVREQALVVVDRLRSQGSVTFRELTGDSPDKLTTVCRFLALLELFREQAVVFEQPEPLADLVIRWTGTDDQQLTISDEFDVPPDQTSEQDSTQDSEQDNGSGPAGSDQDTTDGTHD